MPRVHRTVHAVSEATIFARDRLNRGGTFLCRRRGRRVHKVEVRRHDHRPITTGDRARFAFAQGGGYAPRPGSPSGNRDDILTNSAISQDTSRDVGCRLHTSRRALSRWRDAVPVSASTFRPKRKQNGVGTRSVTEQQLGCESWEPGPRRAARHVGWRSGHAMPHGVRQASTPVRATSSVIEGGPALMWGGVGLR